MSDDRDVTLDGPPEPVVDEDGDVTVLRPTGEPDLDHCDPIEPVVLGTYKCARCDTIADPPADGDRDPEPPHECDGCERQGPFVHVGGLDEAEIQAALRAEDMWHTPAGIDADGFGELWGDVREYVRDHWDAGSGDEADAVYAGLTAYALSTWVRENLTFVPHLMLMGKTTGGKTRLLNALARVSYRAVVTASATPASMFRLIERYGVSYYISEYHGLEYDTRRELDAVVRAGQKRGEVVTRAETTSTGYEPTVFDPFAHVAVATQYTPDDDIVNRCIQVRSSPADRDMPATFDEDRGRDLRDRLLHARFRLLESDEWATAEDAAYGYLAERGITGRTREKLLSLVTVAIVWQHLDGDMGAFVEDVVDQDREAAADSEDALVVEAIRDLAFEAIPDVTIGEVEDPFGAVEVPLSDVADRYEAMTGDERSPSWVGHVRSRLGLEKARKSDGTVITDPDLGPKLRELCEDHNLGWEALEAHRSVVEVDPDDIYEADCPECDRPRQLTHRHAEDDHRMCSGCADEYREAEP